MWKAKRVNQACRLIKKHLERDEIRNINFSLTKQTFFYVKLY